MSGALPPFSGFRVFGLLKRATRNGNRDSRWLERRRNLLPESERFLLVASLSCCNPVPSG